MLIKLKDRNGTIPDFDRQLGEARYCLPDMEMYHRACLVLYDTEANKFTLFTRDLVTSEYMVTQVEGTRRGLQYKKFWEKAS